MTSDTKNVAHWAGKIASNGSSHSSSPLHQDSAQILQHHAQELKRLDNQHFMLKRLFGKNVLSPVTFKKDDKVLDACTGTAVWLLDVAREIPESVSLVGFDVEDDFFPSQQLLPKNVKLHLHSVLSLPDTWTNTFTLVHQRLLISALRRTEWQQAVKELYRVTKPGGWVELCEIKTPWPSLDNKDWITALDKVYGKRGLFLDCANHLASMMWSAGFVDVCHVEKFTPIGQWGGEDGKLQSENLLSVFKRIKESVRIDGGYTEERVNTWVEGMEREYDEREEKVGWVVCYGRKPEYCKDPLGSPFPVRTRAKY